jgi:hypothetical protein
VHVKNDVFQDNINKLTHKEGEREREREDVKNKKKEKRTPHLSQKIKTSHLNQKKDSSCYH